MPFAGELLQVREEERDWEGAAERLLRSFGLSLLVPDECYARVAGWVDAKHLGGRLVYFRVRRPGRHELPELHRDSLVREALGEAGLGVLRVAGARAGPPFRRGVLRDGRAVPARGPRHHPGRPDQGAGASATRRTTATASTTAAATCSAGPTRPRSPPSNPTRAGSRGAARRPRGPHRRIGGPGWGRYGGGAPAQYLQSPRHSRSRQKPVYNRARVPPSNRKGRSSNVPVLMLITANSQP